MALAWRFLDAPLDLHLDLPANGQDALVEKALPGTELEL